jgi:hypothetical protein
MEDILLKVSRPMGGLENPKGMVTIETEGTDP